MNDAPASSGPKSGLRIALTAIVCLAIVGGSIGAVIWINQTEPVAEQIEATRKSAALVETLPVQRGTYTPELVVLGTVEAAQEITLSPRVRGQVINVSPDFVPGGMVRQGELLLELDPTDFENEISIRQSELEQAKASLRIEEGRQTLAKKELALLEGTIEEANRALVLREPQIASIKAEVNAAIAAVERANLDLQRTRLYAPFDAQIIRRSVNVGSQVGPGDNLARLVGVEEYWVMAAVPVRSLQWVQFPEGDVEGSTVILRNSDAWPSGVERYARVARMIGSLDQQTRLARVLITVNNPLGGPAGPPPLILDTLIEAQIQGRPIENVVRLPRDYVRENDTVWVMQDNQLQIRKTDIVFRDARFAYISSGLDAGDEVVTTTLATVADGVGLRKIGETTVDANGNPMDGASQ